LSACRRINSELRQITTALSLGLTKDRFSDLLQSKVLSIEKIKEECQDIPDDYLKFLDRCISNFTSARESWQLEHNAAPLSASAQAMCAANREACWNMAIVNVMYCSALTEHDPSGIDAIFKQTAEVIYSEARKDVYSNQLHQELNNTDIALNREPSQTLKQLNPYLTRMTKAQIITNLRTLSEKAKAA
jgi:hypothetical protein